MALLKRFSLMQLPKSQPQSTAKHGKLSRTSLNSLDSLPRRTMASILNIWEQKKKWKAVLAFHLVNIFQAQWFTQMILWIETTTMATFDSDLEERKVARAFSHEEILQLLAKSHDCHPSFWLLRKAYVAIDFCGGSRPAEMKSLQIQDCYECPNGDFKITYLPEKEKSVVSKTLAVQKNETLPTHCYASYVKAYLSEIKKIFETGPLFWTCMKGATAKFSAAPMGKHFLAAIDIDVARDLGLPDPESYTGHTFHRSSATHAADQGTSYFSDSGPAFITIFSSNCSFCIHFICSRRSRKELLYNTAYVLRACGKDFYDTLPVHQQCGKVEGGKSKCGHQYVGNAVRPDTKWPEKPGTKWSELEQPDMKWSDLERPDPKQPEQDAFGEWHKWTMWRKKRYMHLVSSILQTLGLCIPHCCPCSSGSKPLGCKYHGFVKYYFAKWISHFRKSCLPLISGQKSKMRTKKFRKCRQKSLFCPHFPGKKAIS